MVALEIEMFLSEWTGKEFCLSQLVWHKPNGDAASWMVRVLWKTATS